MKIKEAIEENKEWFEEMFDTIIPWEDQFVAVDKLVWVRCRGLPLKLWNTDCFKHIAALLGTLIEVDEATLALEELEYARFKIRVSVGCEAKITSYMKINEVLYQVSVEEECTVPDYKLYQCHWSDVSESMETEAASIASNASERSGSRDYEDGGKEVEENQMAEMSIVQPPLVQGHRRSEPIVPDGGGVSFLDRPLGPFSAPIFSTIIGRENLGSKTPTTLSRADVDKRFGPSETAQEGELSATYKGWEGRCRSKNHNEALSKSGPVVCGEEKLWNGSPGSLIFFENLRDLDESEQGGQIGIGKATPHHEKARNGAITAPLPISLEATEESRRNSLRTRRTEAKGVEGSTFQALTEVEENEGGGEDHVSYNSVSRVEDSLRESQEREANQPPKQLSLFVTKNKQKQSHFQSDSKSNRIKDSYFLFGKQRKKGNHLTVDEVDNQKRQVHNSCATNSSATLERRVFWVGESSKNSK